MHIGIYINNENISSVDCKNLLAGNPGIGGTEYCVLLLAQAYKMYYSNNKVTLFVAKQGMLSMVEVTLNLKFIILLAFVGLAWEKEKVQDNNDEW